MKITIKGYITCKDAENYSDCADNYAYNTKTNRFAISDGVTKSFFPKIWSDILVNSYVTSHESDGVSIKDCQKEWLQLVVEKVSVPSVKWFTKNAFVRRESGFATFVSLRFDKENWIANALGDSFLFFIPKGEENCFEAWTKLSSKPLPVVFDSYPDYYSSRGGAHGDMQSHEGRLESGTFLLMTDALSEWMFSEKENALNQMREKWIDQSNFQANINELRESQKLNNDDSSILIIEVEDDGNIGFSYALIEVTNIKDLITQEEKQAEVQNETSISENPQPAKKVAASSEVESPGNNDANNASESTTEESTHDVESLMFSEADGLEIRNADNAAKIASEGSNSDLESSEKTSNGNYCIQKSKPQATGSASSSEKNTTKKEITLSLNTQNVYKDCAKIYEKALQSIESKITERKHPFSNEIKLIETEQTLIKEKLKETYGISFKD